MGVGTFLRELLKQASASRGLADAANVVSLVPIDAQFVSAGPYRLIADVSAYINEVRANQVVVASRRQLDAVLSSDLGAAGLLVLAGQQVRVITEQGEQWHRATTDINELVAVFGTTGLGHSPLLACVLSTKDGDGLAYKSQMPVRAPNNFSFRTVPRVTNSFSSWDAALAPYGVTHRIITLRRT